MELIILCEIFIYKKWITQKYLNGIKKVNRKSIIFPSVTKLESFNYRIK